MKRKIKAKTKSKTSEQYVTTVFFLTVAGASIISACLNLHMPIQ